MVTGDSTLRARWLRRITGQEFTGFEPDKWQQWWNQRKTEYEQPVAGR